MLMLISTSAVAKQSSFVGDSLSVTGQTSRSSDVSAPVMPDSYDIEVDGLYYKITSISDREVELVGGEGVYSGSIEIPSELEYRGKILKVTSIGDMAFYNSDVTNVTIGGNVKKIGQYAFSKSAISKIVIPPSVITLEQYSFDGCSQLVDVNFEDGTDVLKFKSSSNWTVKYFSGCPIRKLYIGRTIDHDASYSAFDDLSNTLEIEIGPYVTALNYYLLAGASKISSLKIPASVTYLGEGTFDRCTGLKSVIFEDGTNTLLYNTSGGYGSAVFEDSPLNYVYIGRNFRNKYSSGGSVFNDTPITKIDISCVVTELVELYMLDQLQEINIPASVTKILGSGFYGCDNLSQIVCNSTTPPAFESNEGFSNSVFANATLYVPAGCVKAYESAKVWGNFFDIQEISLSGINEVSNVGKENHADVFYDANGVRHKNLIKGLNITKTKNGIVKKIYVR